MGSFKLWIGYQRTNEHHYTEIEAVRTEKTLANEEEIDDLTNDDEPNNEEDEEENTNNEDKDNTEERDSIATLSLGLEIINRVRDILSDEQETVSDLENETFSNEQTVQI
jgi:hypothetical protein